MLPDVEKYTQAYAQASRDYSDTLRELDRAHYELPREGRDAAYPAYVEARLQAGKARDAARDAAWDALKGSDDPLVAWIAKNCGDHAYQAGVVLGVLPATLEQLQELAAEYDWCGEWDDYLELAIKAGVITGDLAPAKRDAFARWVSSASEEPSWDEMRSRLNELIDDEISTARAEWEADQAKANAELRGHVARAAAILANGT